MLYGLHFCNGLFLASFFKIDSPHLSVYYSCLNGAGPPEPASGSRLEFTGIFIMVGHRVRYMNSHSHLSLFPSSKEDKPCKAFHNADFSSPHFTKSHLSANMSYSITKNSLILLGLIKRISRQDHSSIYSKTSSPSLLKKNPLSTSPKPHTLWSFQFGWWEQAPIGHYVALVPSLLILSGYSVSGLK